MLIFQGRVNTFGILDRGLVLDVIAVGRRVALDDVQRVAVEVAGAIEPGLIVEVDHVDDQRVAFPAAARIAHPESIGPRGCGVPFI